MIRQHKNADLFAAAETRLREFPELNDYDRLDIKYLRSARHLRWVLQAPLTDIIDWYQRYQNVEARIKQTPELQLYSDIILYARVKGADRLDWALTAPIADIVDWALHHANSEQLYYAVSSRIHVTPELENYRDIILHDWDEGDEHLQWALTAPVADIIDWADPVLETWVNQDDDDAEQFNRSWYVRIPFDQTWCWVDQNDDDDDDDE